MPVVFGEMVSSVEEIVAACDRHGDRLCGTYRAHYRFDATTTDPYTAPRLERPEAPDHCPPGVALVMFGDDDRTWAMRLHLAPRAPRADED